MGEFVSDIVAEPAAISAMIGQAADFLRQAGVDARTAHHVALALDELLTNVTMHGGGQAPASVRITIHPDRVQAEIVDSGIIFDPRQSPDPDLAVDLAERPIGGLGLLLVRRLTSGLDYQRSDDRNRTSFWVDRSSAA
jgi:anti-sigma regulatory factor (Ser/Thr protein kinase)